MKVSSYRQYRRSYTYRLVTLAYTLSIYFTIVIQNDLNTPTHQDLEKRQRRQGSSEPIITVLYVSVLYVL